MPLPPPFRISIMTAPSQVFILHHESIQATHDYIEFWLTSIFFIQLCPYFSHSISATNVYFCHACNMTQLSVHVLITSFIYCTEFNVEYISVGQGSTTYLICLLCFQCR